VTFLPPRIKRASGKKDVGKRSPAHRAWVRGHACCACGSQSAIVFAHVRCGTDGGTGIKPSDRYGVSLCDPCHRDQHQLGEPEFERRHSIDMKALAEAFFRASPHRHKLEQSNG
jgi:hypothetical protein